MQRPHPFRSVAYVHDATIACIGAHGARDGGIVIVGTGSVGFAVVAGREIRVGGYGFPISDEGSGADLGLHAIRLALRAYDERSSLRGLTRTFGVSRNTVTSWLKKREEATAALADTAHARRHRP